MISDDEQKNREEKLSQFIDELNQENKPLGYLEDGEADEELSQLFDTVKAIKRLRGEDIPQASKIKVYAKKNKWKSFCKYGTAAACMFIAIMSLAKGMESIGRHSKDSAAEGIVANGSCSDTVDPTNKNDSKAKYEPENAKAQIAGSSGNIAEVYASCSAAEKLLKGLPEDIKTTRVLKLSNSSYKYYVSCGFDEGGFMDIYILPGIKGYGMDYKGECYSVMGGVLEEAMDEGVQLPKVYEAEINILSWSGEDYTITIAANKGYEEIRNILYKATGSQVLPLSQEERQRLQEEN